MAAEHWFRWHHGTVNDPKWRVVASRASSTLSRNVTVGHVLSIWAVMLECASQSSPRGSLDAWDDEDVAAGLGIDPEEVFAIRMAMHGKTLDGNQLTAWNRRQPKAEDASAAGRKRLQREREKAMENSVTGSNDDDCHDMSRTVTTETETETETDSKEQEAKASLSAEADSKCPHQAIIDLYHEHLPANPRIKVWDGARADSLRTRWREDPKRQNLEYWARFFRHCAGSAFLTGRADGQGSRPFLPGLDWLVKSANFAKIIEHRYHDRSAA